MLACVGLINQFNDQINPITGEKEIGFDYFYINSKNNKTKILPNQFPDSLEELPFQQEFNLSYLENNLTFKVLFQNKVYLYSNKGIQLSEGYDNIYETKFNQFFYSENYVEKNSKNYILKGLINTYQYKHIECKYKHISINITDSLIYCCSAVFDNLKNDDVYYINGKFKTSSVNHIEYASANYLITKVYVPKMVFLQEELKTKKVTKIEADYFNYLKNNVAAITNKDNWYLYNLLTHEKSKIDKPFFQGLMINLMN